MAVGGEDFYPIAPREKRLAAMEPYWREVYGSRRSGLPWYWRALHWFMGSNSLY